MIIRAVRKNENDQEEFCFGHGYTDYKRELACVEQDIETALLEFKNDCFFALQNGIDWKVRLGYHNQKEYLDEDIQNVILSRQGVISIVLFESNIIDRVYNCNISVLTIYSDEELSIRFSQAI